MLKCTVLNCTIKKYNELLWSKALSAGQLWPFIANKMHKKKNRNRNEQKWNKQKKKTWKKILDCVALILAPVLNEYYCDGIMGSVKIDGKWVETGKYYPRACNKMASLFQF